jgi:hypothetical protein
VVVRNVVAAPAPLLDRLKHRLELERLLRRPVDLHGEIERLERCTHVVGGGDELVSNKDVVVKKHGDCGSTGRSGECL